MLRSICFLCLFPCIAAVVLLAGAEDKPALREALALEKVIQDAIAAAEPSVACILVSRSDGYAELDQGPSKGMSGKLGGYRVRPQDVGQFAAPARRELAMKLDLSDPSNVPESFGSGVVIDEHGLLLTNYHVVRDATKIYVRLLRGMGSYADIHAADPRSDLAVLKLIDRVEAKPIKLGDTGKVRKGQFVICLSNPYAAGSRDGSPSASQGIISNIRRRAPGNPKQEKEEAEVPRGNQKKPLQRYSTLFQTDARLNLGCSGGALINLRGEMIGLTTSLAALSGGETAGGYAVPIDAAIQKIVKVLKEGKQVEYGFLGVSLGSGAGRGDGVRLDDQFPVIRGSPAEKAGLTRGDTILKVNGVSVNYTDDLFLALGMLLAGSEAELEVRSATGGTRRITATLVKYHVEGKIIASNVPADVRGIRVEYTSVLTQTAAPGALTPIRRGVYVKEVKPGSAADKAQIRILEVITRVNGQPVNTPDEFYQLAKQPGPLELAFEQGRTITLD